MYKKSIAITAVLAASILSVVAISTPMAFADESETETEQELKQKNVGSGESTNDNCGQNLIDVPVASTLTCATFGALG
jgi:FlaG/FlaF family flagellin (archaellin)